MTGRLIEMLEKAREIITRYDDNSMSMLSVNTDYWVKNAVATRYFKYQEKFETYEVISKDGLVLRIVDDKEGITVSIEKLGE